MQSHPVAKSESSRKRGPLVSIVIPVYNGSNYLSEAVDSALAQTYSNFEVIVVNDGSDDGGATERIALSYGDRVRYCRKENGGVGSALNAGIRIMGGDYFSWLSHDDVYSPEKVGRQVRFLEHPQEAAVLYSDYEYIDARSQVIATVAVKSPPDGQLRQGLLLDTPIHGCTTLIPRVCFDKVGLFDEGLRTTQDYDMWFRLAKEFKFLHVREVLVKSRVHDEQGTVSMSPLHIRECNTYLVSGMRELVAEQSAQSRQRADLFMGLCAVSFMRRGFFPAAIQAFNGFLGSGGLKLLVRHRYRTLFCRYLCCGLQQLRHKLCLQLFRGGRFRGEIR